MNTITAMTTATNRNPRELAGRDIRSSRTLSRPVRFGLVGLIVLVGGLGFLTDFSRVLARVDPVRAASIGLPNGQTLAAAAGRHIFQNPDRETRTQAAALAREALRLDPTATEALQTLALVAQLENDQSKLGPLLSYSFDLSRRQVRAHFWGIEEAVTRGDVKLALKRYDLALRVSEAAQTNLFPVLASSTREPLVRRELINVLAGSPDWGDRFFTHLAENSSSAPGAGQLFAEARSRGIAISKTQWATLVKSLIAQEEFDQAWSAYLQLNPSAARNRLRDPRFTRDPITPFEWAVSEEMGLSTSLLAQPGGGRFEVSASPGSRDIALAQIQLLPSGRYRLSGAGELVVGESPQAYWTLACRGGRELARIPVRVTGARISFDGTASVDTGCPLQDLRLHVGSEIGSGDLTLSFTSVQLEPVRSGRP